jgi:hypothetical protein
MLFGPKRNKTMTEKLQVKINKFSAKIANEFQQRCPNALALSNAEALKSLDDFEQWAYKEALKYFTPMELAEIAVTAIKRAALAAIHNSRN